MRKYILLLLILSSLLSCTLIRGTYYGSPGVYDYNISLQDTIHKSSTPFLFAEAPLSARLSDTIVITSYYGDKTLEEIAIEGGRGSFLIIQDDTIKYEKYSGGHTDTTLAVVFSVTKSVVSLLCGIAVDRGYIDDVNDPVTKYLPELKSKDPNFEKLTIEHLLDMRTGIRFSEKYNWNPFAKLARLYYGQNHEGMLKKLKFDAEPGSTHYYHSIATTILGIIIEKASNMPLAKFAEESIWEPLGMEQYALMALDDSRNRNSKAFGGLSTVARDLAKIGRLYMNYGEWNGEQIVSREWIERSVTPNDENEGYQYCWYSYILRLAHPDGYLLFHSKEDADKRFDESGVGTKHKDTRDYYQHTEGERIGKWRAYTYTDSYYALGLFGQVLYVNPEKNIIAVRLGEGKSREYQDFMEEVLSKLL